MKTKSLFIALLITTISMVSHAQQVIPRLSVNGWIGYTIQEEVWLSDSYYGYIEDAAQYGGSLEYLLLPTISAGLTYTYSSTRFPIYDSYRDQQNRGSDAMGISYLTFDATKYLRTPISAVMPYGGIGVGLTFFNVKDYNESYTKFAWAARLGLKIRMNEHVSLFAQAQMQSMVQGASSSIYFGTGGVGTGFSFYSNIYQFTFGGGLSIGF